LKRIFNFCLRAAKPPAGRLPRNFIGRRKIGIYEIFNPKYKLSKLEKITSSLKNKMGG